MSLQAIIDWLSPFIYGLVLGYFWNPIWEILKKIWTEAKQAKEEWSNPK